MDGLGLRPSLDGNDDSTPIPHPYNNHRNSTSNGLNDNHSSNGTINSCPYSNGSIGNTSINSNKISIDTDAAAHALATYLSPTIMEVSESSEYSATIAHVIEALKNETEAAIHI